MLRLTGQKACSKERSDFTVDFASPAVQWIKEHPDPPTGEAPAQLRSLRLMSLSKEARATPPSKRSSWLNLPTRNFDIFPST
jgi:hypothetical protein